MSARKPEPLPPAEFVPWAAAHFQSEEFRDRFIRAVATLPECDAEVEPMRGVVRGALVRWRPGQFLRLNDLAYAHGGRIIVSAGRSNLAI